MDYSLVPGEPEFSRLASDVCSLFLVTVLHFSMIWFGLGLGGTLGRTEDEVDSAKDGLELFRDELSLYEEFRLLPVMLSMSESASDLATESSDWLLNLSSKVIPISPWSPTDDFWWRNEYISPYRLGVDLWHSLLMKFLIFSQGFV